MLLARNLHTDTLTAPDNIIPTLVNVYSSAKHASLSSLVPADVRTIVMTGVIKASVVWFKG